MREALKVVASDGLVRLELNRGAWVTSVTVEEVEAAFSVLAALQALAAQLACDRITRAKLQAVRECHERMGPCFQRRDLDGDFRLNRERRRALVAAARDPTLSGTCRALAVRVQCARRLADMSEDRWVAAMSEYDEFSASSRHVMVRRSANCWQPRCWPSR